MRRLLPALGAGVRAGACAAHRGVLPRLARLRQKPHVRPAGGPARGPRARPARRRRGHGGRREGRGGAKRQIRRRLFPLLPPQDAAGAGRRLGGARAQARGPAGPGAPAARGFRRARRPRGGPCAPEGHEIHPHPGRGHAPAAGRGAGAHRRDAPPPEPPGVRPRARRRVRTRAHTPAHGRGALLGGEDALLPAHGRRGRHGPLRRGLRRGLDGPDGPGRLCGQGHPGCGRPALRLLRPAREPHPLTRRRGGRHPARGLYERHGADGRLPLEARGLFPPPAPLGARGLAEHLLHSPARAELCLCGALEAFRQPAPEPFCALLPGGDSLGGLPALCGLALRGAARRLFAVYGPAAGAGLCPLPPGPGAPELRRAARRHGPPAADPAPGPAAALGGPDLPGRCRPRPLAHGRLEEEPPRLADCRPVGGPGAQSS